MARKTVQWWRWDLVVVKGDLLPGHMTATATRRFSSAAGAKSYVERFAGTGGTWEHTGTMEYLYTIKDGRRIKHRVRLVRVGKTDPPPKGTAVKSSLMKNNPK
jgi:hypothetical protein